jgi:radical SAM protein with 4Fe4S-binding SPASM domain
VKTCGSTEPETVQFLWIHIVNEPFIPQQYRNGNSSGSDLSAEEWLNVVDEAAALGAESCIISVGAPLAERPEVWAICEWAQTVHDMRVGVYVYGAAVTEVDVRRLAQFNKEKTRLFVDSEDLERLRYADEQYGVQLCIADGLAPDEPATACHLPENMTCVCSKGALYTCGLVLGNERFRMGHVNRERLDGVMANEDLPHHIPEGAAPELPRRCNGCPPLMERRMRGQHGHG